ncbi:MAG TPA: hypothetical protein VIG88_05815 [Lysobacter sp.]
MKAPLLEWEPLLDDDTGLSTERCRVPGGWLVRSSAPAALGAPAVALAFVPDRHGAWTADWHPDDDA